MFRCAISLVSLENGKLLKVLIKTVLPVSFRLSIQLVRLKIYFAISQVVVFGMIILTKLAIDIGGRHARDIRNEKRDKI